MRPRRPVGRASARRSCCGGGGGLTSPAALGLWAGDDVLCILSRGCKQPTAIGVSITKKNEENNHHMRRELLLELSLAH